MSNLKAKIALAQYRLTITKRHGLKLVLGLVLLGGIIGSTYTYVYMELSKTKTVRFLIEHTEVAQAKQGTVGETEKNLLEESKSNELHPAIENSEPTGSQFGEKATSQSSQIISLIKKTFPENPEVMVAIAKSESGKSLNQNAVNINRNGSKDCGLMQINSIHGYDCEWLKIPENNMIVARKIYDTQGLSAWVSYNSKNYLYNLPQ